MVGPDDSPRASLCASDISSTPTASDSHAARSALAPAAAVPTAASLSFHALPSSALTTPPDAATSLVESLIDFSGSIEPGVSLLTPRMTPLLSWDTAEAQLSMQTAKERVYQQQTQQAQQIQQVQLVQLTQQAQQIHQLQGQLWHTQQCVAASEERRAVLDAEVSHLRKADDTQLREGAGFTAMRVLPADTAAGAKQVADQLAALQEERSTVVGLKTTEQTHVAKLEEVSSQHEALKAHCARVERRAAYVAQVREGTLTIRQSAFRHYTRRCSGTACTVAAVDAVIRSQE